MARACSVRPGPPAGRRLHFLQLLGDIAKQIAAGAAISTDMVKGYAAAFESAGRYELIFIRATALPDQFELLAGAVRSTLGPPRVHGLVNGLG
jgi:hypothetical protein